MKKRNLLQLIATLTVGATVFTAHAQEAAYPSKPIRIVVGSAPGAMLNDICLAIHYKEPTR